MFVADFIGRANFLDVFVHDVSPKTATVSVLGREWAVGKHPAVGAEGAVTLLVRPESVRLAPTDAADVAGSTGWVLSSMFYGDSIEYEVETEAGNITVSVPDPHGDQTFAPGQYLDVSFEQERAWLLPLSGESDHP